MAQDDSLPSAAERAPDLADAGTPGGPAWVYLVAAAAALLGAWLAPPGWPEEAGSLEVAYRGRVVVQEAVRVGERDPIQFTATSDDLEVFVDVDGGVPADDAVSVVIAVERGGRRLMPPIGDVTAVLELADGRREPIPVLRWDETRDALVAQRRPPLDAPVVVGLLGLVIVLWVSEAIPLFATSLLIPVVLVVSGTAPATEALAPFFHPVIALFFGGFLMAEAMKRVDLDHLAAISIVTWTGRSPATLFAALVAVSAGLSMFMSNTAAVAVLLPIALAVTEPIDHGGYRRAAILAIAYAATIGGVGSAIGTPANPLAIEFLETYVGREITFLAWFAYGLPMVVLFLPVMGVWVWRRSKVDVDREAFTSAREVAADQLARAGKLTHEQWVVLGVFLAVFVVWLTETWHDLSTGVVAVGGAAALAILGRIEQRDLQRISWASLLTFGGGLTLGVFLVESGASDWIAARLTGLSGLAPLLGTFVVALITLVMTTAASNTASAAMLIPLAIPLSGIIGVDPVFLVLIVAVASSIDFALVIGTPPTMMAYSTGLYTSRQIFRTGIVLNFIGLALLVGVVAQLWSALGLV